MTTEIEKELETSEAVLENGEILPLSPTLTRERPP